MPKKQKGGAGKQQKEQKNAFRDLCYVVKEQQDRDQALAAELKGAEPASDLQDLVADVRALEKALALLMKAQDKSDPFVASCTLSAADKRQLFDDLTEWIATQPGTLIKDVFLFDTEVEEGSGVVATVDLKEGQRIMNIPRKLMITHESALNDKKLGPVIKSDGMCSDMANVALVLYILQENSNPTSFFRPYLDSLPRDFSLPMLFKTDLLIKELAGSETLVDALNLKKSTARQFVHLTNLCKKGGLAPFTFRQFRWAVSIMMSRQNQIPKQSGGGNTLALIPGWDLMNYREGKMTTYFNQTDDVSETYTMAAVKKGNPIYMYYGDRPNSKLFVYQGFVFPRNPVDRVELVLGLDMRVPTAKLQDKILSGLGLSGAAEFFDLPADGGLAESPLLQFARVAVLNKEELITVLKNKTFDGKSPVSARNETAVIAYLTDALTRKLNSQYGYPPAEVNSLVKSLPYGNRRLCLEMVQAEQRLFSQVLAEVKALEA